MRLVYTGLLLLLLGPAVLAGPKGSVHTVLIQDMKFVPAQLEVKLGDEIVWRNQDLVPHTVTAKKAGFRSGNLGPGKTWRWHVDRKGNLPYGCDYHPTMKASLTSI